MMIVSFAWTTNAFLSGIKTETRRFWDEAYMERWYRSVVKDNNIFQAYDKSPRFKGKLIGYAKLLEKPYREALKLVTDEVEIREGHLWGNAEGYIKAMSESGTGEESPFVIKFNKIGDVINNIAVTRTPVCMECLDFYCSVDFFKKKSNGSCERVDESKNKVPCKFCGKQTGIVAVNFKKN